MAAIKILGLCGGAIVLMGGLAAGQVLGTIPASGDPIRSSTVGVLNRAVAVCPDIMPSVKKALENGEISVAESRHMADMLAELRETQDREIETNKTRAMVGMEPVSAVRPCHVPPTDIEVLRIRNRFF